MTYIQELKETRTVFKDAVKSLAICLRKTLKRDDFGNCVKIISEIARLQREIDILNYEINSITKSSNKNKIRSSPV